MSNIEIFKEMSYDGFLSLFNQYCKLGDRLLVALRHSLQNIIMTESKVYLMMEISIS